MKDYYGDMTWKIKMRNLLLKNNLFIIAMYKSLQFIAQKSQFYSEWNMF